MRAIPALILKAKCGFPEETSARNPRPETETQQARGEDVGDLGQAFVGTWLRRVSDL